jgi:hypothetical protein
MPGASLRRPKARPPAYAQMSAAQTMQKIDKMKSHKDTVCL